MTEYLKLFQKIKGYKKYHVSFIVNNNDQDAVGCAVWFEGNFSNVELIANSFTFSKGRSRLHICSDIVGIKEIENTYTIRFSGNTHCKGVTITGY